MSTQHYTVVFERETNGTISAWVIGLPGVYAAAETMSKAKEAIRSALDAHLIALEALNQSTDTRSEIHVLKRQGDRLDYVGVGALLGKSTSRAKAEASRANGRKGGRPRSAGSTAHR